MGQPSAVAKRQNRGDARRQPSIPDKTRAKSVKVGSADKIAKTKTKAYERSAWRLCMLVHEFKVSCRWVGTAGAYIVSVGFPLENLNKWLSGWFCSYLPEGRVVASCVDSEDVALVPR